MRTDDDTTLGAPTRAVVTHTRSLWSGARDESRGAWLGHDDLEALISDRYAAMLALASRHLVPYRNALSMEPSDIVHDAYLRLARQRSARFRDGEHFLAIAAITIRRVIVDELRRRTSHSESTDEMTTRTCGAASDGTPVMSSPQLELRRALERLAMAHPRRADLIRRRLGNDSTMDQVAGQLRVSRRTAWYDWDAAMGWLRRELSP